MLSTVIFASQANAEKTTYANQTGRKTIGQESSVIVDFASGDWRERRLPEGQPGPQMQPGPSPYVATGPYGQMMMPGMAAGYAPYGAMPAGYATPAGYAMPGGPAPGQPMMDPNVMPAANFSGYGCPACGGAGCEQCMGGRGGNMGRVANGCNNCDSGCGDNCGLMGGGVYCGFSRGIGNAWNMDPYGGPCAPRWADVVVEATFFNFEPGYNNSQVLASLGAANNPVLNTDNVDYTTQGGVRMSLNRMVSPGGFLEFSYLGIGNWSQQQSVTGAGNLFSPFSAFGTNPVGGYAETDAGSLMLYSTSNNFNSFELNFHRFFTAENCWWQSGWWIGLRYVRVDDSAVLNTQGATGTLTYLCDAKNDLFGAQIGMDTALRLTTRWTISCFGEVGVYGNRSNQESIITFTGASAPLQEKAAQRRGSMVVEAGGMSTFKLFPRATLRAGYQIVYIDGIALGGDSLNFQTNGNSALGTALAGRSPVLNDNGNALYYGPTVGFEYVW